MTKENTALTQHQSPSLDQPEESEAVMITPLVDIYENKDEIVVVADFPGVSKEALSIRLDRSELVIEGAQDGRPPEMPIPPLAFSRSFRVPNTVDPDGVSAELKQGVLRVRLAKSEAAKPKRIEVQTS